MVSIPLSNVSWGPIDALERDLRFADKWIEPSSIKRCLSSRNWVVSGEKGSGKSAIRKALTEIYKDQTFAIAEVDFQDVTFTALYSNILEVARTASLSKLTMLSNYWQYAIFVELANACVDRDPTIYAPLLEPIPQRRRSAPLNKRLLQLLEEAWNKIDDWTGAEHSENHQQRGSANLLASAGLTAEFVHHLSRFPLDQDFVQLRSRFFSELEARGHRVILILDGFDRLRNDGTEADAINLIFASLVDATLNIKTYKDLPSTLEIKVFLPYDRYLGLNLRDSDKVEAMHSPIRWDASSLQEFIGRRIALTTKQQGLGFPALWRQVFPDLITNSRHNLQEDSFEYILRHTMYRPRHMQMHLIKLADTHEGKDIDPSLVPKSIVESSKAVADNFVKEYSIDYPWLQEFVQYFHMRDNIMPYSKFRDAVYSFLKKYPSHKNRMMVEETVDALYAMGFFGLIQFVEPGEERASLVYPPTRQSKRHYVDFFYKNPRMTIHQSMQDDTSIALHPVFIEYVGLRSVPNLIIG